MVDKIPDIFVASNCLCQRVERAWNTVRAVSVRDMK